MASHIRSGEASLTFDSHRSQVSRCTLMHLPEGLIGPDAADLTATRVFLNGQPRVEVVGGSRPGNNLQYIP